MKNKNEKVDGTMTELLAINETLEKIVNSFPKLKNASLEEVYLSFNMSVDYFLNENLKKHKNVNEMTGIEAEYILDNLDKTNLYSENEIKLLKSFVSLNDTLDKVHEVGKEFKKKYK